VFYRLNYTRKITFILKKNFLKFNFPVFTIFALNFFFFFETLYFYVTFFFVFAFKKTEGKDFLTKKRVHQKFSRAKWKGLVWGRSPQPNPFKFSDKLTAPVLLVLAENETDAQENHINCSSRKKLVKNKQKKTFHSFLKEKPLFFNFFCIKEREKFPIPHKFRNSFELNFKRSPIETILFCTKTE
jgi:hypothetical protein